MERIMEMFDILANTFMTATRTEDQTTKLRRVRDLRKWDAPRWWRRGQTRGQQRFIDLDKL